MRCSQFSNYAQRKTCKTVRKNADKKFRARTTTRNSTYRSKSINKRTNAFLIRQSVINIIGIYTTTNVEDYARLFYQVQSRFAIASRLLHGKTTRSKFKVSTHQLFLSLSVRSELPMFHLTLPCTVRFKNTSRLRSVILARLRDILLVNGEMTFFNPIN